jgi:hypothetical protein
VIGALSIWLRGAVTGPIGGSVLQLSIDHRRWSFGVARATRHY